MKKAVVLLVALIFIFQFLHYYRGVYHPPAEEGYRLEEIPVPVTQAQPYREEPQEGEGTVLIDSAHNNSFSPEEIRSLLRRLTSKGLSYEFSQGNLGEKLKYATSLVVISPSRAYSEGEVAQVGGFLERGGRVLLISDPQREDSVESLASSLGVSFEEGYIYNMENNDGNFRNVYFSNFSPSPLTRGLHKVVLYTSCPVSSSQNLVLGGGNTRYSRSKAMKGLAPLAQSNKTLAVCDLTFLRDDFNAIENNPRLISNIAGFLASSQRSLYLEAFPYFLEESRVVYAQPSFLNQALELKSMLPQVREIGIEENLSQDSIILGTYSEQGKAPHYLGKIVVGSRVEVPSLGEVSPKALIYLPPGERKVLVVLGEDEEGLDKAVEVLKSRELSSFLVTRRLALIPDGQNKNATEELGF